VLFGSLGADHDDGGRSVKTGSENARARFDIRVFFIGLALWIIGSIGVPRGRLIKAVIARPARSSSPTHSAVQFHRNPDASGWRLVQDRPGAAAPSRLASRGGAVHMCIGAPVNDYFEFALFHDQSPAR